MDAETKTRLAEIEGRNLRVVNAWRDGALTCAPLDASLRANVADTLHASMPWLIAQFRAADAKLAEQAAEIERLADAQVNGILNASDEDILAEAQEKYGDTAKAARHVDGLIDKAKARADAVTLLRADQATIAEQAAEIERLRAQLLTAHGRWDNAKEAFAVLREDVLHHPEWNHDHVNEALGMIDEYAPDE